MVIAVASGKGGTGKTTIAVSLAQYLAENGDFPVLVSDADVEAPNAHLFLKPRFSEKADVNQYIPRVDDALCSGCGICADVCQFNAIVLLKDKPKVFPALCHGCGSCTLQCPEQAIEEIPRMIGRLDRGLSTDDLLLRQGLLNQGEPMAVPVIAALKKWEDDHSPRVEIIDSPPGASCPVVEAVRGADYVLLVTEPTPFGLHDLKQALQVTHELGLQAGVIINRAGLGEEDIRGFCREKEVPVLMEIPLDRKIGEGLARGKGLLEIDPEYRCLFGELWHDIQAAGKAVAP
jgi:MinD superfamily P-loop ATPase